MDTMDKMVKIENDLLSGVQEHDEHRVSKFLQIKQWAHLYSNMLRGCSSQQLVFIGPIIWFNDHWEKVGGLKGVKLNRCSLGKRLLASEPDNPLSDLQKYLIACWCCFDDEIGKLAIQLKDFLLGSLNSYAAYGKVVEYWTRKKLESSFHDHALYRYENAVKDNNVEAVTFFLAQHNPSPAERKKWLKYAATDYHLPFNKAKNEMVCFVMDRLSDPSDYRDLLKEDMKVNKYYSMLHHLIRNFEFDHAEKLYNFVHDIGLSYFDYATLIYNVLYNLKSLSFFFNDLKFYNAGYEMLRRLHPPHDIHNDISSPEKAYRQYFFSRVKLYGTFTPPHLLSEKVDELRNIIIHNLQNANMKTQEYCAQVYSISNNFYPAVVEDILKSNEGVLLDQFEIEKAITRGSNFGHDSSDEEDTVMSYDEVKAVTKLEEFNRKNTNNINEFSNFGFIVHAVSIKLLYSPDVQTAYYKKRPGSKKCRKLPNFNEICSEVDNAVERIVGNPPNNYSTKKIVTHAVCNIVNTKAVAFLNAIVNKLLDEFFEKLMNDDKYKNRCLRGWGVSELDRLYNTYTKPSDPESNPNLSFDLSKSQSNFAVNFFSNLRLHNRLERRNLKRHYSSGSDNSTWKYSESTIVESKNEVSLYNECRVEKVQFDGIQNSTYPKIYNEALLTMREMYELPNIFTGKNFDQITSHAASLHFLLFGIEAMRNPSALIHGMMIFDLIKKGQLSWEEAFAEREMPMSINSATKASRIQNSLYNENYMPHKYLYEHKTYYRIWTDEDHDAAREFVKKEKILTLKCLNMKGFYFKESFDEKCDLKMEYVSLFFKRLQEACLDWYKINLSPLSTDGMNLYPQF